MGWDKWYFLAKFLFREACNGLFFRDYENNLTSFCVLISTKSNISHRRNFVYSAQKRCFQLLMAGVCSYFHVTDCTLLFSIWSNKFFSESNWIHFSRRILCLLKFWQRLIQNVGRFLLKKVPWLLSSWSNYQLFRHPRWRFFSQIVSSRHRTI